MSIEKLFASALQTTNRWLGELSQDMGWTDDSRSYHVLRVVLHALRDRLPPAEAVQLSAEMPLPVRGVYFEGWVLARKPAKAHAETFTGRVENALRAANQPDVEAVHAVHAVFRLLDRHVSAGEIEQVKAVLPEDIRRMWPRLATA